MDQAINILQGLLTPVIASVVAYIAWQQWQLNKHRLNLERYDRRLRIYEEVRRILSIIMRDADVSIDDLSRFRTSVSEADFLFASEIPRYIDEIYGHGIRLWKWNRQYRDYTQEKPIGYNHAIVVEELNKELRWLGDQFGPAKQKFKKYLDVGA